MTICCDSSKTFVELARRAQSTRPVKSGLVTLPGVLETSRAGSGRVGPGQEASNYHVLGPIALTRRYQTRFHLARKL